MSPDSYDFPKDYPESRMMKEVMELVNLFLQRPDVDPDRVYIYGMSMGGIGAFEMPDFMEWMFSKSKKKILN